MTARDAQIRRRCRGDDADRLDLAGNRRSSVEPACVARQQRLDLGRNQCELKFAPVAQPAECGQPCIAGAQFDVGVEPSVGKAHGSAAGDRATGDAAVGQCESALAAEGCLQASLHVESPVQARVDAAHELREVEIRKVAAELQRLHAAEFESAAQIRASRTEPKTTGRQFQHPVAYRRDHVGAERQSARIADTAVEPLFAPAQRVRHLAGRVRGDGATVQRGRVDAAELRLHRETLRSGPRQRPACRAAHALGAVDVERECVVAPIERSAQRPDRHPVPVDRTRDAVLDRKRAGHRPTSVGTGGRKQLGTGTQLHRRHIVEPQRGVERFHLGLQAFEWHDVEHPQARRGFRAGRVVVGTQFERQLL